jgi:hypothetical protein
MTAPIRAVQTGSLATWAYASGVWTAPSPGALTSPWTAFDSILTPLLGDSVEINNDSGMTGGIPGARVGIATITSLGSASTAATLTRRGDFNTSAAIANGVSYEVLDGQVGSIYKGTCRYLTNQGTLVLDSSALKFAPVISPEYNFVDLGKTYGVRGASTIAGAAPLGNFSAAINAASWAAAQAYLANTVAQVLRLPAGLIPTDDPILLYTGVVLEGAAGQATQLLPGVNRGGPAVWSQNSNAATLYAQGADGGAHNTIALVDTTYGTGTAIRMFDTFGVNLNLTLAGLYFAPEGGNNSFHWAATFLPFASSTGLIDSTRGQLRTGVPLRTMFSFFINSDGSVQYKLRITHTTVMVATGTGPAVTVSTGTIPTGRIVHIEPDSVGNTAMAATTFRIRVDDGAWLGEFMVPSAGGLLPASGAFPAGHVLGGVQFTAASGTYHGPSALYGTPADSYENCKTAVLTTGITGAGTNPGLALNERYSAEVTYDPSTGNVDAYLNRNTNATGGSVGVTHISSAAFFAGGHVQALTTETSIACGGDNSTFPAYGATDGGSPNIYLGGVRYSTVIRALMGTTVTGLVQYSDAHELLWFVPGAWGTFTGPDSVIYGWYATIPGQQRTIVMKQRHPGAAGFPGFLGLKRLGINQVNFRRVGIYFADGVTNSRFHDLYVAGGSAGLTICGVAFFNDFSGVLNVGTANDASYGMAASVGGFECTGPVFIHGHGSGLVMWNGLIQTPYLFINPESAFAPVNFSSQGDLGSVCPQMIIDGENVGNSVHPMVSISVASGYLCDLSGSINGSNDRTNLGYGSQNGSCAGRLRWNVNSAAPNSPYLTEIYDALGAPIQGGPAVASRSIAAGTSICDRPGFFWPYNGARPAQPLLATTTTILFDPNEPYTVYEMAAGTTTVAQSISLSISGGAGGPREGHKVRVRIRASQANNVTITDGGAGSATLAAITAGQSFTGDFETPDGKNWFVY